MNTRSTLAILAIASLAVQPALAEKTGSEKTGSEKQLVQVKSLAGPPSEFALNQLPGVEETLIPTNMLVLDRVSNGPEGPTKAAPTSFSTTEGVGFSLVQVTTNYPYFSPSTFYGPNGTRYEFNGSSITCNYGSCGSDQANLRLEAFTNQVGGGVAIFSISGGEVTTSTSWNLAMESPVLAKGVKSVQVDSTLGFDDNVVEVGPSPCKDCDGDGPILQLTTGQAQTLAVSFRSDRMKSLGPAALSLTGLDVNVVDTKSLDVVHTKSVPTKSAALLPRDEAGRVLVDLPELQAGDYSIRLDIEAEVAGLGRVERTAFYYMPILDPIHRLNHRVTTEIVDDYRMQVRLGLDSLKQDLDPADLTHYYAYAEVWSTDGLRPVAWISGMTYPELDSDGFWSLPMMLDARWLAKAEVRGTNFELRNVRIQDPDTFIPVDQKASLRFGAAGLPTATFQKATALVEDSTLFEGRGDVYIPMNVPAIHPAAVEKAAQKTSDPTGLFLVHGWCSPPAWEEWDFPGNTSTLIGGTAEFVDSMQSRSHDNFAQRIRDQGALHFDDAFSVVAHSQGGAAATHLRTFYSSLLDNITAPRRIQSMGTPYGGSTLMDLYLSTGVLGWLIAEIFDFCGPQWNLGTVGAALWRSSIPNSVRGEVFYYRTRHRRPSSFWERLQFWRWRCNGASFVIPGNDDGVVSINQGYLSGGRNMGITDSECHVGGMNHPDQKDNVARNTIMNREGRPVPSTLDAKCTVNATWHTGGPTGEGYYEYWVDASGSEPGNFPIAHYTWTNSGTTGSPTSSSQYGPLFPGLPGQASNYIITVKVTDTSGASDSATCWVP